MLISCSLTLLSSNNKVLTSFFFFFKQKTAYEIGEISARRDCCPKQRSPGTKVHSGRHDRQVVDGIVAAVDATDGAGMIDKEAGESNLDQDCVYLSAPCWHQIDEAGF